MVKIRMFIPHTNLKNTFEEVARQFSTYPDIQIELVHIFGTPQSLAQYGDADILVARGMTYDWLRGHFPQKHIIEVRFSSFDILDSLLTAKNQHHPKVIAVLIRHLEERMRREMEEICDAKILYFQVKDEESSQEAVHAAREQGAEVFIGAGTVCGICDREKLPRIHIHTQRSAVERSLREAMELAIALNHERERNAVTNTILNTSPDGLISLDASGTVLAMNNQAFRILEISPSGFTGNDSLETLCPALRWSGTGEGPEVIPFGDRQLYLEATPILTDGQQTGTLLTVRDTEQITSAEKQIRRELVRQGLTAKYSFSDILGESEQLLRNISVAKRYSKVDSNVLIIGETGTGKELFAHSIHRESRRRNQPFVALNCAALPESLLESELFGYEAGAFSGASRTGKIGLFELANKGTIFLDEIGEIPVALQAKLLRVLQEKEIRRIGSTKVLPVDVRVISATNINIKEKIRDNQFRSDLYYRLNVLNLSVPPLRNRGNDIRLLTEHFLAEYACDIGIPVPKIPEEVRSSMEHYSWPGNVRELRNICERLAVLSMSGELRQEDMDFFSDVRPASYDAQPALPGELPDTALPDALSGQGPFSPAYETAPGLPVQKELLRSLEREKKTDLAKELGISRTTLWRREKQLRKKAGQG